MENRTRVYVKVNLDCDENGVYVPRKLKYSDGRIFVIDEIKQTVLMSTVPENMRWFRYTVRIGSKQAFLYSDIDGRWYVEAKAKCAGRA